MPRVKVKKICEKEKGLKVLEFLLHQDFEQNMFLTVITYIVMLIENKKFIGM